MKIKIVSKNVIEFRYSPTPNILDIKGAIANKITDGSTIFDEWTIQDNIVSFSSKKDPGVKAFISYNRCGLITLNPTSDENFLDYAKDFVKSSWNHLPYQKTIRLGIRSSYLFTITQAFETLLKALNDKLSKLDSTILAPDLLDVAFTYNLLEDLTKINISIGPMKKEQILENFAKSDGIPSIGLFVDIDTFKEDFEANIKQKDYIAFLEFSKESSKKRATTIFDLVNVKNEKK